MIVIVKFAMFHTLQIWYSYSQKYNSHITKVFDDAYTEHTVILRYTMLYSVKNFVLIAKYVILFMDAKKKI